MKGAKRQRILDQRAAGSESAPLAISGLAPDLVAFINRSWTPFHAVEEAARRLNLNGFKHIQEKDKWDLKPGGKYFFTRNFSTLVAFAIGSKYEAGNGFYMVGAHTDSPCLKLKPITKSTKSGYLMVNVECYGGGLW
jgi:aspartyl aminopeptidase